MIFTDHTNIFLQQFNVEELTIQNHEITMHQVIPPKFGPS